MRLAVGPDYAACAPVRGVREGGGDESMRVRVRIEPTGGPVAEPITLEFLNVDPRRAQPRDPLPVRPADQPRAAGDPPAPGAALAHPLPELLDARRAGHALHQLAAGPAVQLPRSPGLPGLRRRASASRSTWSPRCRCSIRSTSSSSPRSKDFPFEYDPSLAHELALYRLKGELTPALAKYLAAIPRKPKQTTNFLVELNQKPAEGHRLPDPNGARRADAGTDADSTSQRLLPRHRLAAGAAAASPGASRHASSRAT